MQTSTAVSPARSTSPQPKIHTATADLSFRIGQRVRHVDYDGKRVTGLIRGLTVDGERGLMVSIALDSPIVIPAGHGYSATNIYQQHAPAHEFAAFDERDEILAELLAALYDALPYVEDVLSDKAQLACFKRGVVERHARQIRGAIAKAEGGAA